MSSRTEVPKEDSAAFLHPKSRKSLALIKKVKKGSKKDKVKQETKLKQSLIADKLLWFQKHIETISPCTIESTTALVEKYIARNDEELEQIKIKQSIGGKRTFQHIARENAICMTKEREKRDFESCGLEIPNVLNVNQCDMLKNWNGDLKFLPNFKFCRFSKKHLSEKIMKNKVSL